MKIAWIADAADNVATVLQAGIGAGDCITLETPQGELRIEIKAQVPFGHKIAVLPIPQGGPVIKYGVTIGTATAAIEPGEHVHIHNVESNRGRGDRRQEVGS